MMNIEKELEKLIPVFEHIPFIWITLSNTKLDKTEISDLVIDLKLNDSNNSFVLTEDRTGSY